MDAAALGAVFPDGTQIVFVRGDFAHQEIWQMQSDGGQARKIFGQPGANYESVVWSPDGQGIAFVQVVNVSGWHEVAVSLGIYDLVSGQSSSLFTTDRLRGALAWARDGRLIYSSANSAQPERLQSLDHQSRRTWQSILGPARPPHQRPRLQNARQCFCDGNA